MDLYGYDYGLVDIDKLPLSAKEKEIVAAVQLQDKVLSKYLHDHNGGHDLITIEDVPSLAGDTMDLRGGKVFELPTGIEHKFYHVGYAGQYFEDKYGNYLHRLTAFQYTMRTDMKKYEDAMNNPDDYQVHHRNPVIRRLPHGNGISNVMLLKKGVHQQYTAITRKLQDMVMLDGEKIPLVKPTFYFAM